MRVLFGHNKDQGGHLLAGHGTVGATQFPNIVLNGDFDTDLSNWVDSSIGTGAISWEAAGRAQIDRTNAANQGIIRQVLTTVSGAEYELIFDTAGASIKVGVGTTQLNDNLVNVTATAGTTTTRTFTASGVTTHIYALASSDATSAFWDNVVVRRTA